LVDTHAHLTMREFAADLSAVLERAAAAGVDTIVCVGVDLESSREAVELASRHPQVVAAVGVHPNESAELPAEWLAELRSMARMPGVVAVGEIGLDYYRQRAERERQLWLFRAQLDLAGELVLPVVVHNREADADLERVLVGWEACLPEDHRRGVLHCFSGGIPLMERCTAKGFYISFAGPITFRNAAKAAAVAEATPDERLLVETDAPCLAPHPHRGERNEPAHVKLVAERLAELRQVSPEEIARVTSANAARLFGLRQVPYR